MNDSMMMKAHYRQRELLREAAQRRRAARARRPRPKKIQTPTNQTPINQAPTGNETGEHAGGAR
jgi:hypothetical protein